MTQVLDLVGNFTWGFGNLWFIETKEGNFVWSDPDYPGGNNTIKPVKYDYSGWLGRNGIPFGRDKGTHRIGDFCPGVKVLC